MPLPRFSHSFNSSTQRREPPDGIALVLVVGQLVHVAVHGIGTLFRAAIFDHHDLGVVHIGPVQEHDHVGIALAQQVAGQHRIEGRHGKEIQRAARE